MKFAMPDDDTALSREEFKGYLEMFDLMPEEFAWLVGIDERTVRGWGGPRNGRMQPYPLWVALLLEAWELCGGPPQGHPWEDGEFTVQITPRALPE